MSYTQLVPPDAFPSELINQILLKKSNRTGKDVENKDDFILQISGKEEYLFGDYQFSQFNVSATSQLIQQQSL